MKKILSDLFVEKLSKTIIDNRWKKGNNCKEKLIHKLDKREKKSNASKNRLKYYVLFMKMFKKLFPQKEKPLSKFLLFYTCIWKIIFLCKLTL